MVFGYTNAASTLDLFELNVFGFWAKIAAIDKTDAATAATNFSQMPDRFAMIYKFFTDSTYVLQIIHNFIKARTTYFLPIYAKIE